MRKLLLTAALLVTPGLSAQSTDSVRITIIERPIGVEIVGDSARSAYRNDTLRFVAYEIARDSSLVVSLTLFWEVNDTMLARIEVESDSSALVIIKPNTHLASGAARFVTLTVMNGPITGSAGFIQPTDGGDWVLATDVAPFTVAAGFYYHCVYWLQGSQWVAKSQRQITYLNDGQALPWDDHAGWCPDGLVPSGPLPTMHTDWAVVER